jgi:hypothetical protein
MSESLSSLPFSDASFDLITCNMASSICLSHWRDHDDGFSERVR